MLEAMAEYYSLNLSDEVKKGMSEKARRGGVQTRPPPIGYQVLDGRMTVNHDEKDIVNYIYKAFVDRETSYVDIAKHLNAMGIVPRIMVCFKVKPLNIFLKTLFFILVSLDGIDIIEKGVYERKKIGLLPQVNMSISLVMNSIIKLWNALKN